VIVATASALSYKSVWWDTGTSSESADRCWRGGRQAFTAACARHDAKALRAAEARRVATGYVSRMRALVQRVSRASVSVEGRVAGAIGPGLLVLLGVTHGDDANAADRLADKVRALRIFDDADGRMNEALGEREILCVSQFTLYGDARRGNRPSFVAAAPAEHAEPLYERFCARAGAERGVFGARMAIELINDGPVTLLLEA
jgi:D-tyrosyl-tRNA(Tyr) deacylase